MSKKTIFKRISLVAITSLGAGVLSVVPASAANNNATNGAFVTPASNVMNIAVTRSLTGVAAASITAATSVGLIANSTVMGTGLTQTATLLSTGTLGVYGQSAAGDAISFVVTGGTFVGSAATDALIATNASATAIASQEDGSDAVTALSVLARPTSGVTSMRIEMYTKTIAETVADTLTIANGSVSRGTLKAAVNVTIATTSASGTYSASESLVNLVSDATAAATGTDVAGANIVANGSAGYIAIDLYDPYGVSLTGVGALVITGTNGAGIAFAGASSAGTPVNITAVSNTTSGTITVGRPAALANKGFSTTVSISWNGVVVATKSLTFQGEVASMVVTPRRIAQNLASSTTTADVFRVTYADSAGNALIGLGTTATSAVSSTLTSLVTGASIGTQGTTTDAAKGSITCAAGSSAYLGGGTATLQMQHVNSISGTIVKSNEFPISCQGNAYTYTAGFDRAVYTPGSIATLTITFKDRDGDLANGTDTWAASNVATITGGPSALAVAIPTTADTATSGTGLQGIKTFQFVVGSTEGDFQAVVSVPDVNTRNSSQTNQTVAYSVKSATTSVSNADVLKSIVALIASINKQIQALQKLILKR